MTSFIQNIYGWVIMPKWITLHPHEVINPLQEIWLLLAAVKNLSRRTLLQYTEKKKKYLNLSLGFQCRCGWRCSQRSFLSMSRGSVQPHPSSLAASHPLQLMQPQWYHHWHMTNRTGGEILLINIFVFAPALSKRILPDSAHGLWSEISQMSTWKKKQKKKPTFRM